MDDIEYNEKTKSFDSDPDLQEKIRFLADVMETNHIIHENTVDYIYHLLKFHTSYLKIKLSKLASETTHPEEFMLLAKYDVREGNFYYLFNKKYLTPNQALEIVNLYLENKHTNESF